jgi:site-specific DNA recombinase
MPERIARMATEMQEFYRERVRIMQTQAAEAPRELQELASRIERLRERMKRGDPDMTGDELQAAIEKAEEKRRELEEQQIGAALSGRAPSILPRAAELYRRQVAFGLEGGPQATLKAACSYVTGSAARSASSRCRTAGSWPIGIRTVARS